VAQDCIKPLLVLARLNDDDVRVWAVWTIASLAECDDNRLCLAREGVLPVLYELARDTDVRIKSYIAAALANLAKRGASISSSIFSSSFGSASDATADTEEVRALMAQTGGADVVVDLARCFEIRVQSYAAAALANFTAKGMSLSPPLCAPPVHSYATQRTTGDRSWRRAACRRWRCWHGPSTRACTASRRQPSPTSASQPPSKAALWMRSAWV
jgi:hypothetical protein